MAMLIITRGYTHTHIYIYFIYLPPSSPEMMSSLSSPTKQDMSPGRAGELSASRAAGSDAGSRKPQKDPEVEVTNMFFYYFILLFYLYFWRVIYIYAWYVYIYMHDMYIWICWRLYIHTILCIFALVNPPWLGNVLHFPLKQIESRKRTMTWICV